MHYFLVNKPYGVLSQFTREAPHHRVLGDLYDFPPRVYPVGRLDRDSEGLLILTDDTSLNARLLTPEHGHRRRYLVRVEGSPGADHLHRLSAGVSFRAKGKEYRSSPLIASYPPPGLIEKIPPRDPPVRYRRNVPDAWIQLDMSEGKNRQVRRMCAAVGLPVLRLLRYAIEDVRLDDLNGDTVLRVSREWVLPKLKLR